jgi:hypothetical protein
LRRAADGRVTSGGVKTPMVSRPCHAFKLIDQKIWNFAE